MPSPIFPTIPVNPGERVAWSLAGDVRFHEMNPGNTVFNQTQTSGGVSTGLGIIATEGITLTWSSFIPPTLPDGSVITSIKGVCIATNIPLSPTSIGPCFNMTLPPPGYEHYFAIGASIGTDLSFLSFMSFNCFAGNSDPSNGGGASVGFSFLGVAVVYIPPPRAPIQAWVNINNSRTP